ncbi:MAG: CaiB/BaiF CoA-transferase family protein [Pseudomonadota bacterium]
MNAQAKPLAGLLVIAMEQAVAAPTCSMRLADAGARVIKIERREGDFARGYDRAAKGQSSYFVWLNRGKESVTIDLRDAADRALLERLIGRADVFIQNFAPGAMQRAGLGSATLREKHPRLITVDISGYGEQGEYSAMKAYDLLVQAESGLCSVTGRAEGPGRVGVSLCDVACGMNAHAAVLEALIARSITGQGAGIAVSLFDGMADLMNVPLMFQEGTGAPPARIGLAHPSICPYGAFATADGSLVLISIQNEREWGRLCSVFLREPELPQRSGFTLNVDRVANRGEVDAYVGRTFATLTRAECAARLGEADIAYGFVNEVSDLAVHPALRRLPVETPAGIVEMAAPAAVFADIKRSYGPVPALGEQDAAIRAEFAA